MIIKRIICTFYLISLLLSGAEAQVDTLSFSFKHKSLEQIFEQIENQTDYYFLYNNKLINAQVNIDKNIVNKNMKALLLELFEDLPIQFTIINKQIVLFPKATIKEKEVDGHKTTYSVPMIKLSQWYDGQIIDYNTNSPIFAANIAIKGKSGGAISDENGNFRILINQGDTILISCIGYRTQEIPQNRLISNRLYLQKSLFSIKEVYVVGYGEEEKRDLLGAVSKVKYEERLNIPVSFDSDLVGKASGVFVGASSGVPGSATSMSIRGITSLNSDSNYPLIVIDGVPIFSSGNDINVSEYNNTSIPGFSFSSGKVIANYNDPHQFERNPLAIYNPEDIASVEILKDAFATAIYGSRGATGVILITTKKNKQEGLKLSLHSSFGFGKPYSTPKVLNGAEYNKIYSKYYEERFGFKNKFNSQYNTNWIDAVTRTAFQHNNSLSMQGGSSKNKYYFNISEFKASSYIINNDFRRYSSRLNFSTQLAPSIEVGSNMYLAHLKNTALAAQQIYREAVLRAPNLPVYNNDGSYFFGKGTNPIGTKDINPVASALRDINESKELRSTSNLYIKWDLPFDLHWKTNFGFDLSNTEVFSREMSKPNFKGGAIKANINLHKYIVDNTLSHKWQHDKGHFVKTVIGQSFEFARERKEVLSANGFKNDNILDINQAENLNIADFFNREWALLSYFARINYQYRSRYLFGLSYRIDGSSRFTENNRYIGFPALSAGWILSEENFLKSIRNLNQLKLRFSIGLSGIDGSGGYYGYQGQYSTEDIFRYAGSEYIKAQQVANPHLKWETTRTYNFGLDLSLFQSRFNLELDVYNKLNRNFLVSSYIPLYMGETEQLQNIGKLENKGIEISISTVPIQKEFQWVISATASHNKSKLLKLNFDGELLYGAEGAYKLLKEGEEPGSFYMYQWKGVDHLTGNPLWQKANGEITQTPLPLLSDEENRLIKASAYPKVYGGIKNSFHYKSWSLECYMNYSWGGKMLNGGKASLFTYSSNDANNLSTEILEYWKIYEHQTSIPKLLNESIYIDHNGFSTDYTVGRNTDRFLEDASFIKLKEVNISYTFRPRIKQVKRIKVYAKANNLYTLTSYSGSDPEVNAYGSSVLLSGIDELNMPQTRAFSMGCIINF